MKIKVKVRPNSREQKIEQITNNEYKISLKSTPENNKANLELIKLLKKHFKKIPKIIKGKTSKNKTIKIE